MTNIRKFSVFFSYSMEHINKIHITHDKYDVLWMPLLQKSVEGNNKKSVLKSLHFVQKTSPVMHVWILHSSNNFTLTQMLKMMGFSETCSLKRVEEILSWNTHCRPTYVYRYVLYISRGSLGELGIGESLATPISENIRGAMFGDAPFYMY